MAGLMKIDAIMDSRSNRPDLSRQKDLIDNNSATSNNITPSIALKKGYRILSEPPDPDVCPYCGKVNEREGLLLGGTVVYWQPFPTRCSCTKAVADYEKAKAARQKQEAENREAEKRKRIIERTERLLGRSGIKQRFRERTFENFRTDTDGRKKAYEAAKEYADNFKEKRLKGDGLYIEGTNGTGKTHLAAAITLKLINEGIPVICKTSSDLLLDIKKTFTGNESEAEVLEAYKNIDLLVIDDLGKEQCSDWSVSILYSILNDRYEDMRPTIITTNYNSRDLERALTPKGYDGTKIAAILSRLKEC